VADMLRREFGLGRSTVQFDDFRRLAVILESSGLPEEAIPALALFLSLQLPDSVQRPILSPQGLRQRTMEWLGLWLFRQADDRPVLLVAEDIHWADASTLEWLDQIASDRSSAIPSPARRRRRRSRSGAWPQTTSRNCSRR
jgi:hypothetical protein